MKFAKLTTLALLLAACATTVETAEAPEPTAAPTTTTAAPQTIALAYRYQPDSEISYRVAVEQEITIQAEGDSGAFGSADLPLDGQVSTAVETVMTYQVFPGPIAGTTELVVTASFEDVAVSGTMNGEPFSPSEDDLGISSMPPVNATFIVDEAGTVVSSSLDSLGNLFGGGLGSLQALGQENLSRPIGPRFPAHDLGVGDSWTDEKKMDGPSGPITTRSTHTVTGIETVDGTETFVIETVSEADAVEIDFTDIFRGMFEGMKSFEGGEDREDLDAVLGQLEFLIAVAPSRAAATTWFDAEAGLVVKAEMTTSVTLTMSFQGPDETTGEIVGFTMEMSLDQSAHFDLETVGQTLG